jgi:hypothetical protein
MTLLIIIALLAAPAIGWALAHIVRRITDKMYLRTLTAYDVVLYQQVCISLVIK